MIIDTNFRNDNIILPNIWFTIPLLITIATFIISFAQYDLLPKQIPVQFDFSGHPTRYISKSLWTVASLPTIQLFITLLLLGVNISIKMVKQQIDSANPLKSRHQSKLFRRHMSALIIGIAIISSLQLLLAQLSIIMNVSGFFIPITTFIFLGIILCWVIYFTVKIGQGGSRIKLKSGEQTSYISPDEDRYWKFGLFYFNRNDPSFFVEKRFGIGVTVNFARPTNWLFLLGIITIIVIMSIIDH